MFVITMSIAIGLVLIATVCDCYSREIPNWISLAITVLAAGASTAGWLGISILMVLAGGLLGSGIGMLLFRFAHLGGGDAKLIAALGCLLGPVGVMLFLFWMALAGGVLALIALASGKRDYAYAPAILAGMLITTFVHLM